MNAGRDVVDDFVRLRPGRFLVAYDSKSATSSTFAFVTLTCWRSAAVQGVVASFAASADGRWLIADTTDTGGTKLAAADWQGHVEAITDEAPALTIVGGSGNRIYGTNESVTTTLYRLKPGGVPEQLFLTSSRAGFAMGPDPSQIAWDDASSIVERPSLRITSLDKLPEVGPIAVRNAGLATWSPDGKYVASRAVRDDGSVFIEVIDAKTRAVLPGVTIDKANRFALPSWSDAEHACTLDEARTEIDCVDIASGTPSVLLHAAPGGHVFQAASWPNVGLVYVIGTTAAHAELWLKRIGQPARLYRRDVRGDLNAFADADGNVYLEGFDGVFRVPQDGRVLPLRPNTPVDNEYPLEQLPDGTLYYSRTLSRVDLYSLTL
jgi:hypothetical protein